MTKTVLAIGAHPDDEVLGAGGTLAKHAAAGHDVYILIVTEGTTAQYDDESIIEEKKAAARECAAELGAESVRFGDLPDMRLDTVPHVDINDVIETAIDDLDPDIVYTHSGHDVNKDHVAIYESTRVATRPGSGVERVLAYEVPSATDWVGGDREQFTPTTYVDIEAHLETKIDAFGAYETEFRAFPHPRSKQALRSIARSRGTESGFAAAEAFQLVSAYTREI